MLIGCPSRLTSDAGAGGAIVAGGVWVPGAAGAGPVRGGRGVCGSRWGCAKAGALSENPRIIISRNGRMLCLLFFNARGAPPPLARAAALEDSLSSRGPQALFNARRPHPRSVAGPPRVSFRSVVNRQRSYFDRRHVHFR